MQILDAQDLISDPHDHPEFVVFTSEGMARVKAVADKVGWVLASFSDDSRLTMPAQIDHIVVVAPSLFTGAALVEQSLGVPPGPGRKHPHMGTHNLLLSLGPSVYLEVVAIDPDAPPVARPRWFGLDDVPAQFAARLAAWVANTDDIHTHTSPDFGVVEQMEREGLTWQMTSTADGNPPLSGAAPLLIQRATNFHPASRLPDVGLRLRCIHIQHPRPGDVAKVLTYMALADAPHVVLTEGAVCKLAAEIETPAGVRWLGEQKHS